MIPWNIQIPEGERVIGMDKPDWWYESGEMPAVFNWAIDGLQRLELRGYFTTPEVSREAIEDYRIETNPAREYLLDNFEIAEEEETAVSLVYKGYVKFCETNGYRALGSRTFGKEVRRIYPTVEKFRYGPRDDRSWRYRGLAARTVIPHDL